MARLNIDILGISELKCLVTGKFNADESLEEIEWPSQSIRVAKAVLAYGLQPSKLKKTPLDFWKHLDGLEGKILGNMREEEF